MRFALYEHNARLGKPRGHAKSHDADPCTGVENWPCGIGADQRRKKHGVRAGPITVAGLPDFKCAAEEKVLGRPIPGALFGLNCAHGPPTTHQDRPP